MTLGLATRLLTIAIGIKTTAIGIAWYLNPAVNRRRARGALPQAPLSVLQPAESEGERDAAAEKDPGHVAIGEEGNSNADAEGTQQSAQLAAQDSEASSAVPTTTTMHASNAPVHAPLEFGSTHLLELPEELLLRVLARLTAGLPLSLPLKDDSRQAPQSSEGFIAAPTFQGARPGMCFKKGPAGRSCLPDFARVTFCDVLAPVGVCCKAFANIVPEAAAVFVRQEFARHTKGWTEQPSWACQLREYYTSPMQEYLREYYIPDLSVKREAEAKAQVEKPCVGARRRPRRRRTFCLARASSSESALARSIFSVNSRGGRASSWPSWRHLAAGECRWWVRSPPRATSGVSIRGALR